MAPKAKGKAGGQPNQSDSGRKSIPKRASSSKESEEEEEEFHPGPNRGSKLSPPSGETNEMIPEAAKKKPVYSGPPKLILKEPDKPVEGGSASDSDIGMVVWPQQEVPLVCTMPEVDEEESRQCRVKLSKGIKVSPCVNHDGQKFSTTDYAAVAALFTPTKMMHPMGVQVSNFARHREFTDYLRKSGVLQLFGTSILSVYRMETWPPPDLLIEQLLAAMGKPTESNSKINQLVKEKAYLKSRLAKLESERNQLLEQLDQFPSMCATYELLDQDEVLPPRPENSQLDLDYMRAAVESPSFKEFTFGHEDDDESNEFKLLANKQKPPPRMDVLEIPLHDKRMLL